MQCKLFLTWFSILCNVKMPPYSPTDESFTSYHPEAHLPLSLVKGRPVYMEVGLLNHPEPDLVLLVHYCLVYTYTPYASWMLIYDG